MSPVFVDSEFATTTKRRKVDFTYDFSFFFSFLFSLSLSSVLFYELVFTLQNILYSVDNYGLLISGAVKQILKNWQTSE